MQKIDLFVKKKWGLSVVFFFIKLKCIWLQTGLLDLKKHQTIEILLRVDISAFVFFKNIAFFECF